MALSIGSRMVAPTLVAALIIAGCSPQKSAPPLSAPATPSGDQIFQLTPDSDSGSSRVLSVDFQAATSTLLIKIKFGDGADITNTNVAIGFAPGDQQPITDDGCERNTLSNQTFALVLGTHSPNVAWSVPTTCGSPWTGQSPTATGDITLSSTAGSIAVFSVPYDMIGLHKGETFRVRAVAGPWLSNSQEVVPDVFLPRSRSGTRSDG